MVMEEELQWFESEEANHMKVSEENMKRVKFPKEAPKIEYTKMLEVHLRQKYLGLEYSLETKIQNLVHRETHEISPFTPDLVWIWANRWVDVAEFGVPRDNK